MNRFVVTRDGTVVNFDAQRIHNAIVKALRASEEAEDSAEEITSRVVAQLPSQSNYISIEDIQDLVEKCLMETHPKTAKNYIMYRYRHLELRKVEPKIPDDHIPTPWGPLGSVVFYRTYSRKLNALDPDSKMESYPDTVKRVLKSFQTQFGCNYTRAELARLRKYMLELKCLPGGRFLWQCGTKTVDKLGNASIQNCAFRPIDTLDTYTWLMDLAMLGVGIGFSVAKEHTSQLPPVRDEKVVIRRVDHRNLLSLITSMGISWNDYYDVVEFLTGKQEEAGNSIYNDIDSSMSRLQPILLKLLELTESEPVEFDYRSNPDLWMEKVRERLNQYHVHDTHDSREGWVALIRDVLRSYFVTGKGFRYSVNGVRPRGQPLVSFGGIASGPDPLVQLVSGISSLLDDCRGKKISPLQAHDIACMICKTVVAGNIRRVAAISIGDKDDIEYLQAKRWDLHPVPDYRFMSNNTVYCDDINTLPEAFWENFTEGGGEAYGLFNRKLAQTCGRLADGDKYPDPLVQGLNPCGEQSLAPGETCCLAELFLSNFSSQEEFQDAAKLIYRACKHSLTLPCHHQVTEDIVHKNMRMGLSVTGYLQATPEQVSWLGPTYEKLREFDKEYSEKIGRNTSVKLTTVKPSGTVSLMAGVTPGCHPGLYRYYRRRVRIASDSPLIDECRKRGYFVEPTVYQRGTNNLEIPDGCSTMNNFEGDLHYQYVFKDMLPWKTFVRKRLYDNLELVTIHDHSNGSSMTTHSYTEKGSNKEIEVTVDNRTMVVEFPSETPHGTPIAEDMDIIQQLDVVRTLQREWSDNCVSFTGYYKIEDVPRIREYLMKYYNTELKTCSFHLESGGKYLQLPYESISKEVYEHERALCSPLDTLFVGDTTTDIVDIDTECEGGLCPVK